MHDVARIAGVSAKTVSRVVNDEPRVDPLTRSRVQDAIATLGFRRNEQARSLRPGQSSALLGLVTGDVGNPFYSAIARGVEQEAQRRGHLLLTASSEEQPGRERQLIETLLQHNIEGLLIVPTLGGHEYLTPEMLGGVPVVAVDRPLQARAAFDTVLLDNRYGAYLAVRQLLQDGHSRVAVIDGESAVHTGSERTGGYRQALEEAGVVPDSRLLKVGYHGEEQSGSALRDLSELSEPPTAVFATNNRIAVGILREMNRSGHWLPLAVFDDFELADMLPVPVTVVGYDAVEMGRQAAELLFERLSGLQDTPRTHTIPVHLMRRFRAT